jgi:hypothetical protein
MFHHTLCNVLVVASTLFGLLSSTAYGLGSTCSSALTHGSAGPNDPFWMQNIAHQGEGVALAFQCRHAHFLSQVLLPSTVTPVATRSSVTSRYSLNAPMHHNSNFLHIITGRTTALRVTALPMIPTPSSEYLFDLLVAHFSRISFTALQSLMAAAAAKAAIPLR